MSGSRDRGSRIALAWLMLLADLILRRMTEKHMREKKKLKFECRQKS